MADNQLILIFVLGVLAGIGSYFTYPSALSSVLVISAWLWVGSAVLIWSLDRAWRFIANNFIR